ncbi:MAG: response regulator [Bacillota bacterium]|nr:response regulator [Bacillota bacterium]MDW7728464.1 response regulator [Bacillota bacterium]
MNDFTFFIIDDDLACRRILSQIIEDESLGEVIGELPDGHGNVVGTILYHQPEVLLVDLLMPGKDGIEIVEQLRDRNYRGKIVMISQVEKKEMVAQAYAAGIEFYINKPVNRVEVISVIKNITERLRMERSFEQMRDSLEALDRIGSLRRGAVSRESRQPDQDIIKEKTREILADLGLIGEPGSHDLIQVVLFLNTVPDVEKYLGEYRRLKDLYQAVQEKYLREEEKQTDVRAIEQRVRRAIRHAMDHVAALGIEDYNNPTFERYGSKFFDFNELRVKMKELEQEMEVPTKTRVNIKQFINALYWEIKK